MGYITTSEGINVGAILFSPVVPVGLTLWYQDRKQRRDAKEWLFRTLMARRQRDSIAPLPVDVEVARALNLVDVVFAGRHKVIRTWHELYDMLCCEPIPMNAQPKYVDLLHEMALDLGYRGLKQTMIGKPYNPRGLDFETAKNAELREEFVRVLKSTSRLMVHERFGPKERFKPGDPAASVVLSDEFDRG